MSDLVIYPVSGKYDTATPKYFAAPYEVDKLEFLGDPAVRSIPGIVNEGNTLDKHRDWEYAYINPHEGFMGVRWCPSWVRTDTMLGAWQPAGADVYRVQRKGIAGADARTLVFTCSANSAQIPAGDPVVVWEASNDMEVSTNTTHNFFGYSFALKTKVNISACTPSPLYQADGRQIIEIDTGIALPVIDYLPPFFSGENGIQKSTLQLRHWSFYADQSTKLLRLPFPLFFQNTRKCVLSGGHAIVGGNNWAPTGYDWSKDYINFGASLTEELFRKECEGLAYALNDLPPSRFAVEIENKVFHPWENYGSTQGFRTLLNDVWYPIARSVWGQERTLIVKGPGGVNGTLRAFDWSPPRGERAHLAIQMQDRDIEGDSAPITFSTLAESDWLAQSLRSKIEQLGFAGGGVTALEINYLLDNVGKAKKLGRVLTSFYNQRLYTWYYGHLNTDPNFTPNIADVFSIAGFRMEALYTEMRTYANRAGLVFD